MDTIERVQKRSLLLAEVLHRNAVIIDSYQDREGLVLQHYVFHMLSIPEQLITDIRDKYAYDNIVQHVEIDNKRHILKIQRPMSHVLMKSPKFCKYPRNLPSDIGWLEHLIELSLNTCRISGLLPKSIGDCRSLQILILSDNHLAGHIPSTLGCLHHLTFLDLSHNHFCGSIPEELGNLTCLAKCYLSHNQLSGPIPQSFGKLHQLLRLGTHYFKCVLSFIAFTNRSIGLQSSFLQSSCWSFASSKPSVAKRRAQLFIRLLVLFSLYRSCNVT